VFPPLFFQHQCSGDMLPFAFFLSTITMRNMNMIIIQARMGATRLPGKILMSLAGKPMLWHVVVRAAAAKHADKAVVATTTNSEDDATETFCQKNGFLVSRGSAHDVLDRYYMAAREHGADQTVTLARVTGDCPLVDPDAIDMNFDAYRNGGYDYVSTARPGPSNWPRGLDCEVFSSAALEKAYQNATEGFEHEHVTPYLWQNKNNEFKIGPTVVAPPEYARDYRLTVDYPEDLEVMEKIFTKFGAGGKLISVPEVLRWLDEHPEIVAINKDCEAQHRAREAQSLGEDQASRR